jgi:TolB-like protein/Tfp pilus assembly protein PilF
MHTPEKSIAILPFRNLAKREEDEYFSDGVTEELMNLLSRDPGVRVTARTSAFSFKGRDVDAREIGSALGVNFVLEGSVRIHAGKVRVSVQLIDAKSGFLLHSGTFECSSEEVFAAQDDLAARVAQLLRTRLSLQESSDNPDGTDPEAYDLYLQANYLRNKGLPEAVLKAIPLYEKAVRIAPDFALGYAALARCHLFLGIREQIPLKEAYKQSREFALRAVRLDPTAAQAHIAMAAVSLYTWDWDKVAFSVRRATELNPGNAEVHLIYARYLLFCRQFDRAIRELELALRLDPLSVEIHVLMSEILVSDGQYEAAIEAAEKALELNPESRPALHNIGWACLTMGEPGRALEAFERIEALLGWTDRRVNSSGVALLRMGDRMGGMKALNLLHERAAANPGNSFAIDFMVIYKELGNPEESLRYMKIGFEERNGLVPLTWSHPFWQDVRDDPHYRSVIEATGLPAHIAQLEPEKTAATVEITSNTRETITLQVADLLFAQAQDNYSRIVWREGNQIKNRTLRLTLKELSAQLDFEGIIRVHKSYLVNLQARPSLSGTVRSSTLQFEGHQEMIPVSRSCARQVEDHLQAIGV